METLETLLNAGAETLKNGEIEEARLDAWLLLEYLTGKNRAWYLAHRKEPAGEELAFRYRTLINKRAERIPLQYLIHRAWFMGLEFYVDENVLIPRQDTEVLAEQALKLLEGKKNPAVLDLCTGSGCILLSILASRTDARGIGTDVMEGALRVAGENSRRLSLEDRALWVKSDTFSADIFQEKDGNVPEKYDILISNPPYIPSGEIAGLMEEVRVHEPRIALDGGADGLDFYRKITPAAARYLKPEGWLIYEIGWDQGREVSELLKKCGYQKVKVVRDLSGLDRVALGQKAPAHISE